MEYYWEYFSATYFDSVLMGVRFNSTGNILIVLITIHILGEFNGISLRTDSSNTNFHSILMRAHGKPLGKFKWYFFPCMNNIRPVTN